ncbi:MAG: response regulator [Candidatus Omnitrophica bacterium]|nr:response regulator [Candidatus Omnitrophota bacterium]
MANIKVMVVDDDVEFLEELKEVLVLSGYDTVAIDDPVFALEYAPKIKPHVVLLDLKMPKMKGFRFADELRKSEGLKNTSIIAMAAYYKEVYFRFLNMLGIRRYLKKPFFPLDVIVQIEKALDEGQNHEEYF